MRRRRRRAHARARARIFQILKKIKKKLTNGAPLKGTKTSKTISRASRGGFRPCGASKRIALKWMFSSFHDIV